MNTMTTSMMRPTSIKHLIAVAATLSMAACQNANDHGHAHDANGGHDREEQATEEHTVWTESTELFVEFPVLVVGQPSRFAAHFTALNGHQPVREGSVTVSLIQGTKGIRHTADKLASPGIFTPTLIPKEAGSGQLVFEVQTPNYSDRVVIDGIHVYASQEEANHALPSGDGDEGITFLKEQAWKMDFQTVAVRKGAIYEVVHTSGQWKADPSDSRSLVANTSGVVSFHGTLTKGSKVKRGDALLTISSKDLTTNNLEADLEQAQADFEKARSAYERKQKLAASEVVPAADLEVAKREFLVAKSRLETLQSGYASGGKRVLAPFDGVVKSIHSSNGDFVNQGEALLSITTDQSRLLETHLTPSRHFEVSDIHNLWYQPAAGRWSDLNSTGGAVLSVGHEVESDQPMLPVYARVNEAVDMPEGGFSVVDIAIESADTALLIPASALLEDYGSYSVIAQLSGERFERRQVIIGRRNGEQVEVISGLSAGEMIVTTGAYQVKMASMSGQVPAHGHSH